MKEDVCVSVVMITYMHEQYIKQAIEGVLMQKSEFEVELIVADDNSPDNTETIVRKIIEEHPNGHWIKYTRHPQNKGMMPNFIWALQQGEGKYIALCEGDDYWINPLKLKMQVEFLDANEDYIASFHDAYTLKNGNLYEFYNKPIKNTGPKEIIMRGGGLFPTASIVFRNQNIVFPSFTQKMVSGDSALIFLLMHKGKIGYIDKKMLVYRKHEGGVSYSAEAQWHMLGNTFFGLRKFNSYHNYKYLPYFLKAYIGVLYYFLKSYVVSSKGNKIE